MRAPEVRVLLAAGRVEADEVGALFLRLKVIPHGGGVVAAVVQVENRGTICVLDMVDKRLVFRRHMWAGSGVIVYGPACTGSKAFKIWKCRWSRLSRSISQSVHCLKNPGAGVAQDVGHLQHAGANALADQTAHAVFLKAHHGKADHLGAAARNGSAARQTGQVERRADGCAGNGQSQRNANQHRNQNAHQQGL